MANTTGKLSLWMRACAYAVAIILTLGTTPGIAQAGLKEAMNEMFVSTSTDAQAINTQRLKGVYGGSMSLRPVGRGIEIAQFAPPRIDAGCGGVDIFFGSFSFINGAQFEQLVRSIAANAVGFAIKAAINAMCGPCAGILSKLEDALRELNALAKNTCAIANAMLGDKDSGEKLMEAARGIGEKLSQALSETADWAAGANKSQSEKPSITAKTGSSSGADNNPMVGNLVYRAAKETMNNGANTLRAFLSEKETIEVLMGLFGTVIVTPESKPGEKCPEGVGEERCEKTPETFNTTIAEWDQFFKPNTTSDKGVKILACKSSDCTGVEPSLIPLQTWGGVEEVINLAMFGTTDPMNVSAYTPDSIVGAFTKKTAAINLSTRAKTLIKIAPIPLLNAMMEVQKIPGGPETLGIMIAKMLPDYLAYQIGMELMAIGHNTFTAQTKVAMPPVFATNLQMKSEKLTAMRPDGQRLAEMMIKTNQSIKTIHEMTNSRMRASGAGQSK